MSELNSYVSFFVQRNIVKGDIIITISDTDTERR